MPCGELWKCQCFIGGISCVRLIFSSVAEIHVLILPPAQLCLKRVHFHIYCRALICAGEKSIKMQGSHAASVTLIYRSTSSWLLCFCEGWETNDYARTHHFLFRVTCADTEKSACGPSNSMFSWLSPYSSSVSVYMHMKTRSVYVYGKCVRSLNETVTYFKL